MVLLLTFFVLHHDGVAEGEQFEELQCLLILLGADAGHQRMIHEQEIGVCVRVPAEVHWLQHQVQLIRDLEPHLYIYALVYTVLVANVHGKCRKRLEK